MKKYKYLAFILALFFPFTALASVQVSTARMAANIVNSGTRFFSIHGVMNVTGTDNSGSISTIMPIAGTFSNLRAVSDYPPGGATTGIVTLRKNAVNTALTCTITSAATTCSDTANSVSVVAGDRLIWAINQSAGGTWISISVVADFTPTTANETFLTSYLTGISTSLQTYGSLAPATAANSSIGFDTAGRMVLFPEAGVLDKLVASSTAPGAGKTWDFTLKQNAATTSVTCQVNGDTPNYCTDSTNALTIATNDFVSIASVPTGTPAAASAGVGVRFVPTIAGNFGLYYTSFNSADSSTLNQYLPINGYMIPNAKEASTTQVVNNMTITEMSVKLTIAPGGVTARTFTIRQNFATTSAACTITGTETACTWTGTLAVADGDVLNTVDAPSAGSPSTARMTVSLVANRRPATTVPGVSAKYKFFGGFFRFKGGMFKFW